MRTSRIARIASGLSALAVAFVALNSTPALAADPAAPPPVRSAVDANGVDLISHTMSVSETPLSIGANGDTRMVYARTLARGGEGSNLEGSIDRVVGEIASRVVIGETSEIFDMPSSGANTYTSRDGSPSTLLYDLPTDTWTYRRHDGVIATFSGAKRNDRIGNWGPGQSGLVTSVAYPDGEVINYHYKDFYPGEAHQYSRLQSVTNSLGYQLKFEYSASASFQLYRVYAINNAVEYCDPMADACALTQSWPSITYTYSGAATSSSTDALGRTTQVTTTTAGPGGRPTSLVVQRPGANPVTYTFDPSLSLPAGFVTSVTNGVGTWNYSRTRSVTTQTSTVVDPVGNSRVVVSDYVQAVVLSERDGLNRTTSYEYSTYPGRVSRITGPEGDYTAYTYDSRGNLTETRRVAKPGSGLADIVTTASYDAVCSNVVTCNKPNYTLDERGARTDYTYDPVHGGVTKIVRPPAVAAPSGREIRFAYAQFAASAKNASGALVAQPPIWRLTRTSTCHTALGAACVGTHSEVRTTLEYDNDNLLQTAVTTGRGDGSVSATATTTFTYDAIGNLLTEDGPLTLSDVTRYHYDAMRQKVGVVGPDPDGAGPRKRAATRHTYNSLGLETLVERGAVAANTDAGWSSFIPNESISTLYDGLGRKTQAALIAGGVNLAVEQLAYDAADRLTCAATRMNPASLSALPSPCALATPGAGGPDRIRVLGYNAASEVVTETSASGTSLQQVTATKTYTPSSLVETVADAKGNLTTFEYDGFNRLAKIRYPMAGNGAVSSTTDIETFQYDAASNRIQETRRGGATITRQFDMLNRMVVDGEGGAYAYDNLNRPTSFSRGGRTVSRVYDALNRIVTETTPTGAVQFKYDASSNLIRITWPDQNYVAYAYNAAGQLTSVRENQETSGPGVLATFSYDDLGRRTALTRGNGVTTTYSYDPASRLAGLVHNLAGAGDDQSISLTRNLAGQIVSRTSSNSAYDWPELYNTDRTYTANGLNQLLTSGAQTIAYDVKGNLTSDGVRSYGYDASNRLTSVGPTALAYDPVDRLYEISGSATTRFSYAADQIIAEYSAGGSILRRYVPLPGADEPLVWYEGSGVADRKWLVADERGSIIAVTDGAGAAVTINSYDEFGIPAEANDGRFQYAGQPWIAEAALYHNRARAYSPHIGRFLQPDPVGYEDGLNLYSYAHNDPINLVDPSGTTSEGGNCFINPAECVEAVAVVARRAIERIEEEKLVADVMAEFRQKALPLLQAAEAYLCTGSLEGGGEAAAYGGPGIRYGGAFAYNPRTGEVFLKGNFGGGVGALAGTAGGLSWQSGTPRPARWPTRDRPAASGARPPGGDASWNWARREGGKRYDGDGFSWSAGLAKGHGIAYVALIEGNLNGSKKIGTVKPICPVSGGKK